MQKTKILLVILLNSAIVSAEVYFGTLANSMALITDALHNFGDVLSIIIAFIAILFSEKKASRKMTYGYIRSEMMAGFINSLFLVLAMSYVLFESIMRLLHPSDVNGVYMIAVAGIALLANGLSAYLLKDFREEAENVCREEGEKDLDHENLNIKAVYLHLLSDAVVSLGVVIGGLAIYFLRLYIFDSIFSILFSIFILTESVKLFRTTFLSLMDAASKNLDKIEDKILSHKEIKSIHDIHISRPSSKEMFFSAHIVFETGIDLDEIESLFEIIREELKELGITHTILQPETGKYHNSDSLCQSH